jgi:hypothetical protein
MYLIVSWNSSGSGFTRQAFPPLKHVRFPLATPGTEACDAMGGAFRPQWRELPARGIRRVPSERVAFGMVLAALFGIAGAISKYSKLLGQQINRGKTIRRCGRMCAAVLSD